MLAPLTYEIIEPLCHCFLSLACDASPYKERRRIGRIIRGVGDADLPTALRPFMYSGNVVRELIMDPKKLRSFPRKAQVGATASAWIISVLAEIGSHRRSIVQNVV